MCRTTSLCPVPLRTGLLRRVGPSGIPRREVLFGVPVGPPSLSIGIDHADGARSSRSMSYLLRDRPVRPTTSFHLATSCRTSLPSSSGGPATMSMPGATIGLTESFRVSTC